MSWLKRTCAALTVAFAIAGCTTGEGEGKVSSDLLYVKDCWNGPFELAPTFFAANPYLTDTMQIRVQRGDDVQEFSDGLTVLVNKVGKIRTELLNTPLDVGLPPDVKPVGLAADYSKPAPLVTLALYLHDTCGVQNATIYSLSGTITFTHLFSGDSNEKIGEERLTEATFDATFGDPRDRLEDGSLDVSKTSRITGSFRFYFQRGQPAQPFPR